MLRGFLVALSIVLRISVAHAQLGVLPYSGAPPSGATTFSVLQAIQGGGFVTNIQIACDQGLGACSPGVGTATKISRTDTAGAWIWAGGCVQSTANPCWKPVLTTAFPDNVIGTAFGACEVAIAPSDSNRMWAYYTPNIGAAIYSSHGYIYETINKGASWTKTDSISFDHPCDANDQASTSTRLMNSYMAVDPANKAVVLVGSPSSGLQITTNGGSGAGTSWSRLAGVGIAIPATAPTATSATSTTVGTGSKTFTVGAGLGFFATEFIQIWETSAPGTVQMQGTITSYSGTTLVVNVATVYGSGTHSDWTMSGWSPPSGQSGGHLVAFDPSSSVVGGKTQGIFATTYGTGVFHTTDGGSTWTLLNTAGMPITFKSIKVAPNGNLWVIDSPFGDNQGNLWLWTSGGGWVKKITHANKSEIGAVAIDPANANNIFAADYHGYLNTSTDGGATFPTISTSWSLSSSLVPWLDFGVASDATVAIASAEFDPSLSNTLYVSSGVGVFSTNPPTTTANVVWNGNPTLGIQNLDTTVGVSLPGGPAFLANQDRNVWIISNPSTAAPRYYPFAGRNNSWGGNGYVRTNSSFWFMSDAIFGTSLSSDGGATWNVLTSLPANEIPNGGAVAKTMTAYSLSNAVIMLSNDQGPYCLTGGALNSSPVWSACTFTNGAVRADAGWGHSQLTSFTSLAMDQVATTTYCMYSDGTGAASNPAGFYGSSNGASFGYTAGSGTAGRLDGTFTGFFTIASVPAHSGHYFAANLAYVHNTLPNTGIGLWRTTTGCNGTWTQVPNVQSVFQFSIGAACPGGSGYPSVFVNGWVDLLDGKGFQYGIYRSDNADQVTPTWKLIGDGFPGGSFDYIQFLTADVNTCGTVYGGFVNSGFFYGKMN